MSTEATARLRVMGTKEAAPLRTFEAAQDAFRVEWAAARAAHIDLMSHVAGHWIQLLYATKRPIKATEIRLVRHEAQQVAEKAQALLAALDAADRVPGRYADGALP